MQKIRDFLLSGKMERFEMIGININIDVLKLENGKTGGWIWGD